MEQKPRKKRKTHRVPNRRALLGALLVLSLVLVALLIRHVTGAGIGVPRHRSGVITQTEAPTDVGLAATVATNEPTIDTPLTTLPTETPETEPPTTEPPVTEAPELRQAREILDGMTLEEKVYQLFFVSPETLTGISYVSFAGDDTHAALEAMPVGGILYERQNIQGHDQTVNMIAGAQALSKLPLLTGVMEEGGTASVAAGILTDYLDNMAVYGAASDPETVRALGRTMGQQLAASGICVDFAPVADLSTDPANTEVGQRAFGSDPQKVADFVEAMTQGLQEGGVAACVKHFPGLGAEAESTVQGLVLSDKTMQQLRQTSLVPFRAAIDADVKMILVSHLTMDRLVTGDVPASLSPEIVTGILREELGFDGVVITDSLQIGAIVNLFDEKNTVLNALKAGCDMLLEPRDLSAAAQYILDAVEAGSLTEERIDESVLRILRLKIELGLFEE